MSKVAIINLVLLKRIFQKTIKLKEYYKLQKLRRKIESNTKKPYNENCSNPEIKIQKNNFISSINQENDIINKSLFDFNRMKLSNELKLKDYICYSLCSNNKTLASNAKYKIFYKLDKMLDIRNIINR